MTAQQFDVKNGLYIAGEWLGPEGRDTRAVLNPATGQPLGDLPLATTADMDRALEAAARASISGARPHRRSGQPSSTAPPRWSANAPRSLPASPPRGGQADRRGAR